MTDGPEGEGRDFNADDNLSIETVIALLVDVYNNLHEAEATLKAAQEAVGTARRTAHAVWQHVESPTAEQVLSSIQVIETDTAGAIRVSRATQAVVQGFIRRLMS